jgi:hypothetical protein
MQDARCRIAEERFCRIDVKKLHKHFVGGAFWKNLMLELKAPVK